MARIELSKRRLSYIEFDGPNDYVNCETCKGIGRVPKQTQDGLIALIPHDDDRLKPKRKLFYMVVGGLLAFTISG